MRRTIHVLLALACLAPTSALGQTARVQVLERTAEGVRLAVTVDWPAPLATSVEAARVRVLTAETARTLGADVEAADLLDLPGLATPTLAVESAETESLTLSAAPDAAVSLAGSAARLGTAGLFRGRPVADLTARMLTYDDATQRLTRYRRLVLNVRYGTATRRATSVRTGADVAVPFPHLAVTKSVLADGTVFKIPVTEEGIYRLDAQALRAMGLTPTSIDPARIRVFHNGGRPVPAANADSREADLIEVPTRVAGGGDGSFADADGVTFFLQGPVTWRAERGAWAHTTNPYSTQTYVYLKIGEAPTATLTQAAFPGLSMADATTATGRAVRDFDVINWSKDAGSGLTWTSVPQDPGSAFTLLSLSDLTGYAGGAINVVARSVVRTLAFSPAATVRFEQGGTVFHEASGFGAVSASAESAVANPLITAFAFAPSGTGALTGRFGTYAGSDNKLAFDWLRAFYPQTLTASSGYLRWATLADGSAASYALAGFAAAPDVWDVTDPLRPVRLAVQAVGSSYRVQTDGGARELVAFVDAGARRLTGTAQRVAAQNLHGIATPPDLVVVVPDTFRAYAEQLAALRRAEGLRVEVATAEAIANEFGGGIADPRAFRDFLRMLYLRAAPGTRGLRYALFFGDGHFNFRRIGSSGETLLANWIPPFETEETFSPLSSYTSDDYFGLLDENEGTWSYSSGVTERVDIGIGRLNVQTRVDAEAVVAKIQAYEDPQRHGAWRTQYTLAADDGPRGSSGSATDNDLHAKNANDVGDIVETQTPELNLRKIYAMNYARQYSVRYTVPVAHQTILDALNDGTLVFNYSGHGSPNALADETLFSREDIGLLDNLDRLPVFVTATCSFGRWDIDNRQSAAELVTTASAGGAIAAFSTLRLVYTSGDSTNLNPGLNRRFNLELVRRDTTTGLPPRLGDAILITKQYAVGYQDNGRKFNLLGDPSLRFGLPPLEAIIETVNGVDVTAIPDSLADSLAVPLRALDLVTVTGSVRDPRGNPLPSFSGTATVTAYDADRQVAIPYRQYFLSPTYTVSERMWRGEVPVTGGRFTAQFVVPRDIAYANRRGRIAAYVQGNQTDGAGETSTVRVGGSNPNPIADNEGPRLRAYLGDTTFVSGGVIGRTSTLIVRLTDQSGINLGSGVGHELLLTYTVGGQTKAVNLAPFYRATGGYQTGEVVYRLPELPDGAGQLTVRAWDPVGNSGETSLDFSVAEAERLALARVANFPNPTTGPTRIAFEHNLPAGTTATADVRVFTLAGRLVRAFDTDEVLPGGTLASRRVTVRWDGRDADGSLLSPGVYLYRVRVTATHDDGTAQTAEAIERLAIVR
ncbi:MAG: type IX secretion system sortase PorU [Rhodothermales bacterium]|nr:type IX secretion system sortase PorU [Rhodothermales bacterium]